MTTRGAFGFFAVVTVALLAFAIEPVDCEEAPSKLTVAVRQGLLTVDLREAPLDDVLRAIEKQSGVRLIVGNQVTAPVTDAFTDVPLDEGINRLTRSYSRAAIYAARQGTTGQVALTEVHVYGGSRGVAPRRDQPVTTSRLNPSDLRFTVGPDAWETRPARFRIRNVQRLGRPQNETGVGPLTQVLTTDPDPQVRAEAAMALAVIGSEAALTAVIGAVSDDNVTVRLRIAEALGRFSAERARVALENLKRRDAGSQLHGRADVRPDSAAQ